LFLGEGQRIGIIAVERGAGAVDAGPVVEDLRLDVGPDTAVVDQAAGKIVDVIGAGDGRTRPAIPDGSMPDDAPALREIGERKRADDLVHTRAFRRILDCLRYGTRFLLQRLQAGIEVRLAVQRDLRGLKGLHTGQVLELEDRRLRNFRQRGRAGRP
jgi:hypothetical protein